MRELPSGTLTLLFTDIEGSTSLLAQVGEHYPAVLTEYRHLLRTACRQWNGHEVDTQGDAFFAVFARATDALSAAVQIQRAIAAHLWPNEVIVRVRMGLHTGEPQLSAEGYVGLDVHRAARIMSAAHGGQVLFSQTTRDLVDHELPDGVSLRGLGAHRLKDLEHPHPLYQLVIANLPATFPPLRTLDTHPNNLPVQLTTLIGREQEVATVQKLLLREDIRLLTLTGPGGIGKTRLGLQVAAELSDHFTDGVFFVNLAPLSDPALVIPTIANTLNIKESAGQSPLDQLKVALGDKHLLLLLDNFEQVLNAASQVNELLLASPKLKIIVTSRAVLHVRGEQEFAVPPLAVPDSSHVTDLVALSQYEAVALFISRAQAVKPDFQLTNANAPAVAAICARLDGLPLAIELAAARIKLLPPQALLSRLSQRLQVLTSGARDVPARQQTLRNTIEWSYNLLNVEEQCLFRRLSVFVGGCTLQAAEVLGNAGNDLRIDVLEVVTSLLDKSLLQHVEQTNGEPRLMMLEMVREYALEALVASEEMEAIRKAHAAYYLILTEQAEPELRGPQQAAWLDQLERDYNNLRAALQWLLEQGEQEQALRLGSALWRFWDMRGPVREGRDFLEQALVGNHQDVAQLVRAKALMVAAELALFQDYVERAALLCEEGLALFRSLGDTAGCANVLALSGFVARMRGNLNAARSLAEQALALSRETGDKASIADSLHFLGVILIERGEYLRAHTVFEERLLLLKEVGNKEGIAGSLFQLAQLLFFSMGDEERMRSLLQESLTLWQEVGTQEGTAAWLYLAGLIALNQGDTASAHRLLEMCVQSYREMGDRHSIADGLSVLGKVVYTEGDLVAARLLYEESLAISGEIGDKLVIAPGLEGLACVVAGQGELAWAVQLWGAAASLREAVGFPLSPFERTLYEHAVAAVRAQLGEKNFAADWAEGRSMTPEQALSAQGSALVPASTPPTKSAPTYPAGLTAREVEILGLVAQGLTDAQVAERLVISPRTVNWHLTTIYSKLGVSSRAAATRYAIEHHLL